ncbi:hypothetical protein ACWIUA_11625 [Ursidibacter sp. B-7004-1]
MKFKVTLVSAEPFTLTGKLRESIEIEADNIEQAKLLGHMQIARQNHKTYPIDRVSVEAVEIQ